MHGPEIVPEIGMTRNSVQEHQFLQELAFVVPIFVPHLQGQRGSRVAEGTKESISTTTKYL